jgi:hypothetical protein
MNSCLCIISLGYSPICFVVQSSSLSFFIARPIYKCEGLRGQVSQLAKHRFKYL